MAERSITIQVKDGINLAKMMAAIFREYEPSIDKIEMKGIDTFMDRSLPDTASVIGLINRKHSERDES